MAVTNISDLQRRASLLDSSEGEEQSSMSGFGKPMHRRPPSEGGFGRSQDQSVSDIAADIVSDDSKFMRAADTKGRQYANQRGMLNSSIGASASQAAALEYAVPMAQQEASQIHETRIGEQQFKFDMDLAEFDADTRKELLDREADMRIALQDQELSQASRTQMSGMVTDMFEQYQRSVASIMSNPNLPADERNTMLKNAGDLIRPQLDLTRSIFQLDFDWNNSSFA